MGTATKKKEAKGPWTPKLRLKLSAVREGGDVPPGFHFDAASAWAIVGEKDQPLPEKLDLATERTRGMKYRNVSWQEKPGRCFSEERWNPLIALWSDKGGWDFVFDLVMADPQRPWANDFGTTGSFPGHVWYAMRRYLHAATPDAYASARKRVEPLMAAWPPAVKAESEYADQASWLAAAEHSRNLGLLQDHIAFAFDRDGDWVHRILRAFIAGERKVYELPVLVAAATDPALALEATKKWSLGSVYFVFDMVESMGRGAIPVLDLVKAQFAHDKKRVAEAKALAEQL